ncbi:relaxin receptor 2 [Condylostylus longicornis]|uniref:relaxin receptor 2 n=1 Tax=Condylostylus longicornis TaxID=2530218 RepID=UPI00244DA46C|nr:relaxin receptor 2 [Condylostylus longicornis]
MNILRSCLIGGGLLIVVLIISAITYYLSLGPCPTGTFSCDNGTICVLQRQICDSYRDCYDGSDENECGLFHGDTRLTRMIVQRLMSAINDSTNLDKRGKLHDCGITNYPESCQCKQKMIYCASNGLNKIPEVSLEVSHFLIIGNNITLEKDSLPYTNLVHLKLKDCNISDIPNGLFLKLNHLEKLYLNYNNIKNLSENIFKGLNKLIWLFLNSNQIKFIPMEIFYDIPLISWINLTDNRLTLYNSNFPTMNNLDELLLDYNLIEEVNENTFKNLINLEHLSLQYNRIRYVDEKAFWNLEILRDLRLTGNPLTKLSDNTFLRTSLLDALYLGRTSLYITPKLLHYLNVSYLNIEKTNFDTNIIFIYINRIENLKYIVFDRFYYCSMTPHIKKCKPNTDGVSSITDLISKPVLRYSTLLMATLTFIGNTLVIFCRFIYRDENRSVTLVIRNLAISDVLMGFYLLVIGIQDLRYRNRYHEIAKDWISSWYCVSIGILAVISSEVSIMILTFMSFERFFLIANPFKSYKRMKLSHVSFAMFLIWFIGICIAITPIIIWRSRMKIFGTYSGMCFPLHIQERFSIGWEYSAFIFLGLNSFLLILITILYTALLLSILKTRKQAPCSILDCEFAIRFFFIVLTDVTCWAPIIFMKIKVFLTFEISDDIYAWLVVFVLPLNSAVNPFLYTFTTPKYRNQIFVNGWNKITAARRKTASSGTGSNPEETQGRIIHHLNRSSSNSNPS